WERDQNLLLLRNRMYARDRPEEVPDRILGPWKAAAARLPRWEGFDAFDKIALLAAALDDAQALGMENYWGWYVEDLHLPILQSDSCSARFYEHRQPLRLWAGLSLAQKRFAAPGGIVPVAGMSARQRQLF